MIKKSWVLLIAVLLIIVGVTSSAEPITITLWDDSVVQANWVKDEIKRFETANPNIKVKRSLMVSIKYKELINVAARSKSLPDIIALEDQKWFSEFVQAGYLQPITKYLDKKFLSRFPSGCFVEGRNMYKDNYYSFPMFSPQHWAPFYINGDVFKKAGLVDKNGKTLIPKTWADVRKYAKIITQKGNGRFFGFGISARPLDYTANFYYEWARVAGSWAAEQSNPMDCDLKRGKYFFNDPAIKKMFKFLLDLERDGSLYPGYLSQEDEMLRVLFAEGKFGMMTCGRWVIRDIDSRFPDFKNYECVPIPPVDSSGYKAYCDGDKARSFYLITRDSKNPDAAWQYMKSLSTIEAHIRMVEANINSSIFAEANSKATIDLRQWREYLNWSPKMLRQHPLPFVRNPDLAFIEWTAPMPDADNVFWGVMSHQIQESKIDQALQELEDRYNKALVEAFEKAKKKGYNVDMADLKFPDWNPLVDYITKPR